MSRYPLIAGFLSLLVPGLGQMHAGRGGRGATIRLAVLIFGNQNAIWLSLYGVSDPVTFPFYAGTFPRILHDIFAGYGIIFWIWQVVDAYRQATDRLRSASLQ